LIRQKRPTGIAGLTSAASWRTLSGSSGSPSRQPGLRRPRDGGSEGQHRFHYWQQRAECSRRGCHVRMCPACVPRRTAIRWTRMVIADQQSRWSQLLSTQFGLTPEPPESDC
jgi:hypothetical protein